MITVYKTDIVKNTEEGQIIYAELRGASTETKPTTLGEKIIGNGSVFIETDTGAVYLYNEDTQEWTEV